MTQEMIIILSLAGTVAFSLGFTVISYWRLRKGRELLDFIEKQVEDLQETHARNKELFDTNAQRMADQARRINWLETRVRQPKLVSDEVVTENISSEQPKLNITERRHRVIKLSSRGQNVETIATNLGMLPGEVELIINLNRAAAVAGGR